MNKYEKNGLISILSSLEKAKKVLTNCILQNKASDVQMILTECQSAAIEVGTRIENSEGDRCEIVKELEEYCEMLYQISLGNKEIQIKLAEKARKQLIRIGNRIRSEIVCKREVVFMPYKAEMWDSMESVWVAASKDEKSECHIVPLPYYVRDEQRRLSELCYEGDRFPKDIPIEHFNDYVLEEKHPDVIIIHNAYDDGNFVTSIHPKYYSMELKKYTDLLVYIPYFVSIHNVAKHYCALSGILMADLVFVQSEVVRKTYIEEYDRVLKEYSLEKDLPAGKYKFVALGSPKFDKARTVNKEEIVVPKEWKVLIENGGKQIVLYNTHLSGVMKDRCEFFFERLVRDLETFKANENILLLWRPHPLTESTAKSMNPEVAEKYADIVRKYKEEKWGIYDDTPDMYRAIALSDAYYGDISSLVPLYRLTGKPTMINNSNMKVNFKDIKEEYCISDNMTCGEKIWEYIRKKNCH